MYFMCLIIMFILGMVFGSFFNVVGYRLPKGESIIMPPSHCTNCNHRLKWYELIPVFSFIIQGGKCRKCKKKISLFYPIFEICCGVLFALAFFFFEFDLKIIIALTFISMLIIIVVSDYHYMIIPDEVLLFFGILLAIEIGSIYGINELLYSLGSGFLAFLTMFGIKLLGDFMFKKESMGGGDIKMMFIFGMVLSFGPAILSIFLASIIGLPISLLIIKKCKNHEIPFGPFLAVSAIIIMFFNIDFNMVINIFSI